MIGLRCCRRRVKQRNIRNGLPPPSSFGGGRRLLPVGGDDLEKEISAVVASSMARLENFDCASSNSGADVDVTGCAALKVSASMKGFKFSSDEMCCIESSVVESDPN